jgi:apolipoprotein N-acyltransferase
MRRALAIGTAAGLCIGLAATPTELYALAWLGPALLLIGIESLDGVIVRPRVALVLGLASGFATNAWTMRWAVELFERYAMLPWIAALGLASLLWLGQAAPWAIGCWLASAIGTRAPRWITLPLSLLIASSLVPMIFPWRPGVSQTGWLPFVQCAELGGPPLLDAVFLFGSCAAVHALRHRHRVATIVALACITVPLAFGVLRIDEVRAMRDLSPRLRVGLMQHGHGIEEQEDAMRSIHVAEEDHHEMRLATARLEHRGADLVVWPESSYRFGWPRDAHADPLGPIGFFEDGVHGPLLVGSITGDWGTRRWNSVLAIEDGAVTGIADKVHLMTFTEEVPLRDAPMLSQFLPRGLEVGDVRTDVLAIADTRIGILNCFEDLVPDHAREITALGAALLSNHTNDAWFGDTGAPAMHRFLSTTRSIETRRDLVRVVGTGPSGLTNAIGERDGGTPLFEPAERVVDARMMQITTPWVRFGDLVTWPAIALLVLIGTRRTRGSVDA